jgi:hypothetical protein
VDSWVLVYADSNLISVSLPFWTDEQLKVRVIQMVVLNAQAKITGRCIMADGQALFSHHLLISGNQLFVSVCFLLRSPVCGGGCP